MGQSKTPFTERVASEVGADAAPTDVRREALCGLTTELSGTVDDEPAFDLLLTFVAERACQLLGSGRCLLYLPGDDPGSHRLRAAVGVHAADAAAGHLRLDNDADAIVAEVAARRRPSLIADSRLVPETLDDDALGASLSVVLGVPMLLGDEVVGVLLLDDDRPRAYSVQERAFAGAFAELAAATIAQAQATTELRDKLTQSGRQNDRLRRAMVIEDRFTELLVAGTSVRDIATVTARLSGKPCAIHDDAFRRLAVGLPPHGEAPIPRLLDPEIRSLPEVEAELARLTTRRPVSIAPQPSAGLAHGFVAAPVIAGEATLGYVLLMEFGQRFRSVDPIIARRAATATAIELRAERRAVEAKTHEREGLVRSLIANDWDDAASLERRAGIHGLLLDQPHFVALATRRTIDADQRLSPRHIAQAFERLDRGLGAFAAAVDDTVAVILEAPADLPPRAAIGRAKEIVERVATMLSADGEVVFALSSVCRSATDYPSSFNEARQVVRCIQTFWSDARDTVLAAEDLGPGRTFLSATGRAEADSFVGETLGPLLDESDPLMRTLLLTLRVFFDSSRSVRRSAKRLAVHENTIRNRLARIEELTGMDAATNVEHQLAGQLALLVLRLERRLPEASKHP